ncbi:MAG: endonuclease, partial [Paludibacter sp.]
LKPWAIQLLLHWHRQDPVSEKELTRVEKVFAIQQNRNPFIDYPQLVEYIWGTFKDTPWNLPTKIESVNKDNFKITFNSDKTTFKVESKETVPIAIAIYSIEGKMIFQIKSSTNANIQYYTNKTNVLIFKVNSQNNYFQQIIILSPNNSI